MRIRLWLLKLNKQYCDLDCCTGHIIRSTTETMARHAAAANAQDEGSDVWLNKNKSTCEPIKVDNFDAVTEIILTQTKDG